VDDTLAIAALIQAANDILHILHWGFLRALYCTGVIAGTPVSQ
jgi:hypothetical protein